MSVKITAYSDNQCKTAVGSTVTSTDGTCKEITEDGQSFTFGYNASKQELITVDKATGKCTAPLADSNGKPLVVPDNGKCIALGQEANSGSLNVVKVDSSSLSGGEIAGIAVGSLAGLILIYYLYKKFGINNATAPAYN